MYVYMSCLSSESVQAHQSSNELCVCDMYVGVQGGREREKESVYVHDLSLSFYTLIFIIFIFPYPTPFRTDHGTPIRV